MLGIALLVGCVTAFNLIILYIKFKRGRYGDMALDVLALSLLATYFGHTLLGIVIAMVASFIISILLLFSGR